MKKENDAAPMKSNSSSASIKLGYKLYATNFSKIFRTSWFTALIYAIICSCLGTLSLQSITKISMIAQTSPNQALTYLQQNIGFIILAFVLFVLGGLCELTFYSCGLSQLYHHKTEGNMNTSTRWYHINKSILWRTIKAALVNLLFIFIACCISLMVFSVCIKYHMANYTTTGLTVIIAIILGLLLLPFIYISFRYILNPETKIWTLIFHQYKIGLKHLGYIFAVALFSGIILIITQNILTLPTTILGLASCQASMGVAEGDPLNMPSYATLLMIILFLISGFIQIYVRLSIFFPFYYMTGSIDTQEQERKQYQEETNRESQQY